ncbi:MAG: hypothetical protein U1E78_10485 [Gammaproteobacteria bacterium]
MIFRVGAERSSRRSVHKVHDCGENREGNNPENSAVKGISIKNSIKLDKLVTMRSKSSQPIDLHNKEIIHRFASGSYQSGLAYDIALKNQCSALQVLCADGSWQTFQITPLISQTNSAFKAYVLIPEDQSRNDVKVIFRGTEIRTGDQAVISSVNINLEKDAAGSELWAAEGQEIIAQYQQILRNAGFSEKPITLEIAGHSQGGALSQYFTTEVMLAIHSGEIKNVTQIHNSAFNSTGIDNMTSEIFKTVFSSLIQKHGSDFFQAHIGYTHGDPVQQTGESTIWEHIKPNDGLVEMVIVDKGLRKAWAQDIDFDNGLQFKEIIKAIYNGIVGAFLAHENNGYFAPSSPGGPIEVKFPFTHASNQTPEGHAVIQQELSHKLYITQAILKPLKKVLHEFLSTFESSSSKVASADHETSSEKAPLIFSDVVNQTSTNLASEVFHNQFSVYNASPLDSVVWNNTIDMF